MVGSGFSGLAAASVLASAGHHVTVYEKNSAAGGRARSFSERGYIFDMGPSWYWMPEIFERFFSLFGKSPSDYYTLVRLDPGFTIWFGDTVMRVPASMEEIYAMFESEEPGGASKLKRFMEQAQEKYRIALSDFLYQPSFSAREFLSMRFFTSIFRLSLFTSYHSHVRNFFSSPRLIRLMEFPVLFVGGSPHNIPGLYSLMNYAALAAGTWYPMGGFSAVVKAMERLGRDQGADFRFDQPVTSFRTSDGEVTAIETSRGVHACEGVICSADYAHTESLLGSRHRNYEENYWDSRVFSPSCLIFFIGVKKKLRGLDHHNLFFDEDLDQHVKQIYSEPSWPDKPLFYVCCPSKTDASVAPSGHENLFILMPVAPGLKDEESTRQKYFDYLVARLEAVTGQEIRSQIDFKRSYSLNDFAEDYNACRSNAYGLANTLRQTAFMRPSLRNNSLKNLFYAGQLTVPGPGVPPAIISGQIAAKALLQTLKKHESNIR